jgi:allantoin racemase
MQKYRLGVLRVVTRHDPTWLNKHGMIIENLFPDILTTSQCIEDQPEGIFDQASLQIAEPKIVHLALEMLKMEINGLFVSCASDPAVELIQRTTKIPVLGAGTASTLMALTYGKPVGVLGLDSEAPMPMQRLLNDRMTGAARPKGVVTPLDLYKPGAEGAFIDAAKDLKDNGAGAIALACTSFSTLGIASLLSQRVGIPVVDPVIAGAYLMHFMMISSSSCS